MQFEVMDVTKRYHILIADLSRHGSGLGEAQMMGLARRAATHKTGFARHEGQVVF